MNDDTATAREYYRKQEALFGDGKGNDGLYYLEQVDNDLREQGRYRIALKREFNSRYSDFAPVYVPGDTTRVLLASTRKPDPRKQTRLPAKGIAISTGRGMCRKSDLRINKVK